MAHAGSQSFFEQLPSDDFTEEEHQLRDGIIELLEKKGPCTVHQVRSVQGISVWERKFLKGRASLVEWVEHRIGGEVESVGGRLQLKGARNAPNIVPKIEGTSSHGAGKGKRQRDNPQHWFATLPPDQFLRQEEDLRDAIFDFLAAWRSSQKATLWDLQADPHLQAFCQALLPPGVPLQDWIERRIGSEVKLDKNPYSDHVIVNLSEQALQTLQERIIQQTAGPPHRQKRGREPGGGHFAREPPGHLMPPAGERYPDEVVKLRSILQRARESLPEEFAERMTFSDLARRIGRSGTKLNIGFITNIGKKFDIDSPAEVVRRFCSDIVALKGSGDKRSDAASNKTSAAAQAAAPPIKKQKTEHDADDSGPADPASFLARLPADKLWTQEIGLRGALLQWMAKQQEDHLAVDMALEDAMEDAKVKKWADRLLARHGVTLQDWIEHRIGGEVSVGLDDQDRLTVSALIPLVEFLDPGGESQSRTKSKTSTDAQDRTEATARKDKDDKSKVSSGALFSRLPEGRLLEGELAMRDKIVDFIVNWQHGGDSVPLPKLAMAIADDKVRLLQEIFGKDPPQSAFPFRKWLEERLSKYVVVEPTLKNQFTARLA
eukprot:TRINITY_DN14869_c1_g1_i1.p1 TRINITY_DN14869_c1_g1~~TRINITY_DN14869_c1_g1_i1.p1  ORF type:complete len:604 (-),score=117.51 TRINITY_DN14869_c1_g1_i1:21-1832(-)